MKSTDEIRIICPMCNMTVGELVPIYDHDQKHESTLACKRCKKKIKTNVVIEKFKRDIAIYAKVQQELNRKAKIRTEVKPK